MAQEKFRAVYCLLERLLKYVLGWVVGHIPKCVKPNYITALRIALVAPAASLLDYGHNFWSTAVIALAVMSDAIDGALARASGEQSKLGEWLDPLADKVFVITFLVFGRSHFLSEFVVLAIALEVALILGRLIKWWFGKSNGANGWGKMKMHFQSAAVISLVIGAGWTLAAANLYLGVAVVLAAMSLAGHVYDFFARSQPTAG